MIKTNNKKIKILQFPIANSKGGITQYVLQNWKYIDKSKFQFDFATMSKSLDFADELLSTGSKIFYISCYAEDDENQFIDEFRRILVEGKYDIVHLHTKQWKSFNVEKIAKEVGVKKIIVHAHSTGIDTLDDEKRKKEERCHYQLRECFKEDMATDFWACSRMAADFLFPQIIPNDKIRIMRNAIDLTKFKFNKRVREEYRKKLGIKNDFVIGNVGRFVYQKNQEFLLRVIKEIVKMRDDCKLLLIGTGERESKYRQYVEENGLEDRVLFLGHRKDVNCLLQAMDMFALPSRFEGLPIGAIEAQMAGLRCLCSNTITEEVKITKNIYLLPLEVEIWKNEISEMAEEYEREDMTEFLTKAGYNIVTQIERVEEEYDI